MPAAQTGIAQTTSVPKSLANSSSRSLPVDGTEKTEVPATEGRLQLEGKARESGTRTRVETLVRGGGLRTKAVVTQVVTD